MNWPELVTTFVAAVSGFITLWFNLRGKQQAREMDAKLAIIKAETAASKERAQDAAALIKASRIERQAQYDDISEKLEQNTQLSRDAFTEANSTNEKIRQLREDLKPTP